VRASHASVGLVTLPLFGHEQLGLQQSQYPVVHVPVTHSSEAGAVVEGGVDGAAEVVGASVELGAVGAASVVVVGAAVDSGGAVVGCAGSVVGADGAGVVAPEHQVPAHVRQRSSDSAHQSPAGARALG